MELQKPFSAAALALVSTLSVAAQTPAPHPPPPRPLVELNTSYFPFHDIGPINAETWAARKKEIRERVLLASGLFPLPTKTPLNAVVHGRVERDDYTIDRVFFESFPGHYVTGNLYLPKTPPPGGRMPGILSPHGHWNNGRFMETPDKDAKQQLATGAERFESGARTPLHARCVQLARMGCAVFFYDMLGNADSIQIAEHRSGRRPDLNGREPGTYGLYSAAADLRLQSNFGLQTWNSVRALDFLLTVPGVDPARLAVTGESGGGTQTMMLAAIDDRLAAAFPCVMVSTAMQGGCTCENANYLRINQGNIDIAAAFAPKPMGMTAANDWTKELATKGFPDLKAVWSKLGHPDNVMATFNIHWPHNYNHVSRTTMYGFMNKQFKLGLSEPVLEREFVVSSNAEITVWTGAHPKPSGDNVGGAHEKALLKHWSEDNDRQIAAQPEVVRRAWELMIGRAMPAAADVRIESTPQPGAAFTTLTGTVWEEKSRESVPFTQLQPASPTAGRPAVVWLTRHGTRGLLGPGGQPIAAVQKLLEAGITVVSPDLYQAGAKEQPMNPVNSRDTTRNEWRWAACYTYGYNPSLVMHWAHDGMSLVAALRKTLPADARIILAGGDGAGLAAATTAVMAGPAVAGLVVDTEGFRFASLNDQWHPLFVPGAVKYGDFPALVGLTPANRRKVLGENGQKAGGDAVAAAVLEFLARN